MDAKCLVDQYRTKYSGSMTNKIVKIKKIHIIPLLVEALQRKKKLFHPHSTIRIRIDSILICLFLLYHIQIEKQEYFEWLHLHGEGIWYLYLTMRKLSSFGGTSNFQIRYIASQLVLALLASFHLKILFIYIYIYKYKLKKFFA